MRSNRFIPLVLMIALGSCSELYDGYHPEVNEEYLVVEGKITDDPGPYYVKLFKAVPYSNDLEFYKYDPEPEKKAVVKLFSDKGEEITLNELRNNPGTYATEGGDIKGETGHAYWIRIETQKGDIYESVPSILMEAPDITNLSAVRAEKTYLDESLPGGSTFIIRHGMELSCDVTGHSSAKYIKINTRVIQQSTFYLDSIYYNTMNAFQPDKSVFLDEVEDTMFCVGIRMADPVPNIVGMGNTGSFSVAGAVPLGFSIVYGANMNFDTTVLYGLSEYHYMDGEPFFYDSLIVFKCHLDQNNRFLIDIQAYFMDDDVYEYYRNLKNQVTAQNKIFDPIPLQLTANMKCTSQPGKNVFGIFTVASEASRQFNVHYRGISIAPEVEKLNDYYPIDASYCTGDRPPFWQPYF
ncbi:MAG: DUF4249 family protein [Bacteroidales bacterium]|nr:DUF4249 family protein [Bacteroidales bacterium]